MIVLEILMLKFVILEQLFKENMCLKLSVVNGKARIPRKNVSTATTLF